MAPAMPGQPSALLQGASARMLILGIDRSGTILQHDRGSAELLAGSGSLLGTDLGLLISGPGDSRATLTGLIEAAAANRESTAVISLITAGHSRVEAIITAQPVRSADTKLTAQVILRIPAATAERSR